MGKKLVLFTPKGMNKDLSVSKFDPELTFDCRNLRLSTNEGNTMLSWVNERGPEKLKIINEDSSNKDTLDSVIKGVPIGTAIINNQLVLFTTCSKEDSTLEENTYPDYIYRIKYANLEKTQLTCKQLFNGNLGFDINYPLETLVNYEADTILKVYWIDGKNQPRMINIVDDTSKYYTTVGQTKKAPKNSYFDFILELQLKEKVTVSKMYDATGEFPAGVILYAFTYFNRYGVETNIFYTTPLYYITHLDRAAAPDDKVSNIFKISIENVDSNFEYIRAYSIIRTSINDTPIVKRIQDVEINKNTDNITVSFFDTNSTGELIDPSELLYLGGELFVPQTLELKDNTLFLGNITVYSILKNKLKDVVEELNKNDFGNNEYITSTPLKNSNIESTLENRYFDLISKDSGISYVNTLSYTGLNGNATYLGIQGFKTNEYYRLGIQFLSKTGKWSEPYWIGDKQWLFPEGKSGLTIKTDNKESYGIVTIPEFKYTLKLSADSWKKLYEDCGIRNVRAVYVLPTNQDKTILCQGVINPTMYRDCECQNSYKRRYSSWIYRCKLPSYYDKTAKIKIDNTIENYTYKVPYPYSAEYSSPQTIYRENYKSWKKTEIENSVIDSTIAGWVTAEGGLRSLYTFDNRGLIRVGSTNTWEPDPRDPDHPYLVGELGAYYFSTEVMGYYDPEDTFKIDLSVATINSPDIEFSIGSLSLHYSGYNLRKVGYLKVTTTYGDIDILTVTPTAGTAGRGFVHNPIETNGYSALISGNFYEDHMVYYREEGYYEAFHSPAHPVLWHVCMWHRKGSLNNDCNRDNRSAELKEKKISNYRLSSGLIYESDGTKLECDTILEFNSLSTEILKLGDSLVYLGNLDTMIRPSRYSDFYFVGELFGISNWLYIDGNLSKVEYPWRWQPENIDGTKRELSYKYEVSAPKLSDIPYLKLAVKDWNYAGDPNSNYMGGWGCDNLKVPDYELCYYGIDRRGYDNQEVRGEWSPLKRESAIPYGGYTGDYDIHYNADLCRFKDGIPIKYKSSPHLVAVFKQETDNVYALGKNAEDNIGYYPVVEVVRDYNQDVTFNGTSESALQNAIWIPCGPPVNIPPVIENNELSVAVPFKWGDTYFQRYECLKTYPYSLDDLNQVIEIGSFLLESRINVDGRYDRNRGLTSNLNMSPNNFNLINPVYSQLDNFFTYRITLLESAEATSFTNLITWTKTKESGADVDLWTNVTLASILELDGTNGKLNKLIKFNDLLLAFLDTGIALVLYNENTLLSTTEGVPVEIANSGKVQGKRYITNNIGCSNKESIVSTPNGLYFIDSTAKDIYFFDGKSYPINLSSIKGFNTWAKSNIAKIGKWNPYDFGSITKDNFESITEDYLGNIVSYYDRLNLDIYFINSKEALAYSEKLSVFTSFYDYGNTPYFCNIEDTGLWIRNDGSIWKHQAGSYCNFFNTIKPYSMTLVGNPEPQVDKTFTNIEFRADTYLDKNNITPFDSLETWNEYLRGKLNLSIKKGSEAMLHYKQDTASLNRKFRIWRCDIPRDSNSKNDRMRNPWIYIKLEKEALNEEGSLNTLPRTEIHDIMMTYYT